MSPVLISRYAGSEGMWNRIDEVQLDPGDKSVPNAGEAAQLFAALPKAISPPDHAGLEFSHGHRATRLAKGATLNMARRLQTRCHGVGLAKHKLHSPRHPLLHANVI